MAVRWLGVHVVKCGRLQNLASSRKDACHISPIRVLDDKTGNSVRRSLAANENCSSAGAGVDGAVTIGLAPDPESNLECAVSGDSFTAKNDILSGCSFG